MTNSNDPSNKSQSEKQAVPHTQSETNVVAGSGSSSDQPVHTAEVGRETSVTPPPPPPPTRPPATPPIPPSRPQVAGGRGIGGARGSGIPVGLEGIQVGGSAGGSAAAHQEVGGGGLSRPKRKAPETVAPAGVDQPICSVCGKGFGSWKSLFGHMRAHPERRWRGVFAPSTMQQPAQGEGGPHVVGDHQVVASVGQLADIDLNQPQEEEENASADPTSSPSNKDNASGGFDLNMPPSTSDDDDQDSGAAA